MLTCSQSPYPLSSLFKSNPTPPNLCLAKKTITPSKDTGFLFRQKLTYLTNLKINTQKALTLNPNIRSTPLSALLTIENCLSSMGFHRSSIGRILDMYPCLLTSDPHLHLYPTFDFLLNEVEIPFLDISRSINRCPRLLVSSVSHQLRPAFVFLKELGFVGPRKLNHQTTLLLVYNVERSLMSKIEFLMGLGFEFAEVKNMVVRAPGILTLSVERNMEPKFEYFVREMKGDLGELKKFPQFFSFSLERKIKPRHRMLVEYGLKVPLSRMLKDNDGEFSARLFEMRLRMVEKKMRCKYSGVQRRFSKSPQQPPSSSSLRPFPQLNLDEANSDEDDANLTEKSSRGDDDVGNSGDWMEVDACLSCNKRGKSKLLVCCVTGCPVSIHEKCSNFKLAFDDLGRFCCPYCSYKREVSRAKELFQKAMLAKKALLGFIDSEMAGGEASGGEEKRDGGERVEFDGAENRDTPVEDGGDGLRVSDCDRCEVMVDDEMDGALPGAVDGSDNGHKSQEEKTQGIESLEDSIGNEIRDGRDTSETHEFENLEGEEGTREREENGNILKGGEGAESSRTHYVEKEQEQLQQDGCHDKEQGQCVGEEQVHRDAREANSGGGATASKVPHFSDSDTGKSVARRVKRLGKKKTARSQDAKLPEEEPPQPHTIDKQEAKTQKKKVSLSKEPRRCLESPKISSNLYPRNEKRQRLNWTADEEDTLKEGVEKFAKSGSKNTPWRKILEFGHPVFDSTRTPTDLKDKWRNMTK